MKQQLDTLACLRLLLLAGVSWGELGLELSELSHPASLGGIVGWLSVSILLSYFTYGVWPSSKKIKASNGEATTTYGATPSKYS